MTALHKYCFQNFAWIEVEGLHVRRDYFAHCCIEAHEHKMAIAFYSLRKSTCLVDPSSWDDHRCFSGVGVLLALVFWTWTTFWTFLFEWAVVGVWKVGRDSTNFAALVVVFQRVIPAENFAELLILLRVEDAVVSVSLVVAGRKVRGKNLCELDLFNNRRHTECFVVVAVFVRAIV